MKMVSTLLLIVGLSAAVAVPVHAQTPAPAPQGAEVYFISPTDGAKVKGPVVVRFGLKGMGVAPAGIQMEHTGHHHLLVDTDAPADLTKPIPAVDNKVIHFGKGQTETTLNLAPGKHTLQLLLGDWLHIPHATPVMSQKITITVE